MESLQLGVFPTNSGVTGLEATGETLVLKDADAILFTSAMSFSKAVWNKRPDIMVRAIGDITDAAMQAAGTNPSVVGDGSLEGTMIALNNYPINQRK